MATASGTLSVKIPLDLGVSSRKLVSWQKALHPAVFFNTELLHMYIGRKVRVVIQVLRSEGGSVIGKSTDEQHLVIKCRPPGLLSTFVEVIGIADSNQFIQAEILDQFW